MRCPVCGSKQWHKEPSSGLIACSEGHVLQNYRNEVTEGDEVGPHAMRKRTIKSERRRKKGREREGEGGEGEEASSKANPDLYHGKRGRFLYFQCQQLILRQQIVALIELWKFPPEYEIICRDIWALHLSLLPNPPPDHSEKGEESGGSSSSPSSDENGESDADHPLGVNSGSDSSPSPSKTKHRTLKRKYDGLASTVAVLALACWTMRLPVLYRDFIRIIESYQLPYLDPVRLLPREFTKHLTKYTAQALSPNYPPSTLKLHALTSRLAKLIYLKYGICTPEANAAPIVWRAVKCLAGSPTLYTLTKKICQALNVPLTLHTSLSRPLERGRTKKHRYDDIPPEVGVVCAAVIVLKMVYGLDGKVRLPGDGSDPASSLPKLDEYLAVLSLMDDGDTDRMFNPRKGISVGELSGEMLDEYMDFCERALVSPDGDEDKRLISKYFPLVKYGKEEEEKDMNEGLRKEMVGMSISREGDMIRGGESYKIYDYLDVGGTYDEEYWMVMRKVSEWVGVSEDYVSKIIEMFERRLTKYSN